MLPEERKQTEQTQGWVRSNKWDHPPSHHGPAVPPGPLALTQEVGRDGTLQVDVFGAVAVVQFPPDKGVQVEVERLQLVVEMLQVILEGG